jgi:hypothetical protein
MIWLESFETRIICLHIHQRLAPPHRDAKGNDLQMYQELVAVSFSCTILPVADSEDGKAQRSTAPDEVFQRHWNFVRKETRKDRGDMGILAGRVPQGPVQLYVCRESGALALKRYQRAFAGVAIIPRGQPVRDVCEYRSQADRQTWNRRELWEKRIWVDFERDVIFVDTLKRGALSLSFRTRPVDPLVLMRLYAKEEIKKIRRLAVGGRWLMHWGSNVIDQIGPSLMGSQVSRQLQTRNHIAPGVKYEWLMGLASLRELLLDDSFGSRRGEIQGKVLQNYREGAEDVRIDALKFLAYGQRISQGLQWEIPEVRVLRSDEWRDPHFVGT